MLKRSIAFLIIFNKSIMIIAYKLQLRNVVAVVGSAMWSFRLCIRLIIEKRSTTQQSIVFVSEILHEFDVVVIITFCTGSCL